MPPQPRPSPRLVLAAHEAGHAVAAACGLAVGDVLLDPPGLPPDWGVAYIRIPPGDRDRHLFVLAAGPAAAAGASGTWDDARDGHDRAAAWEELGVDLSAYYGKAAAWVHRPDVWRAIDAVAAELDRHGKVSGFRVLSPGAGRA